MEYLHFVVAVIVGVAFPIYAIVTGGNTRKILEQSQGNLVAVFYSSATLLLSFASLVLISLYLNLVNIALIGFSFIYNPLSVFALIACSSIGLWIFNKKNLQDEEMDVLKEGYKNILYLFPSTDKEYKTAIFTSVVAGFCEEIMYRGFLYWLLIQYLPIIPTLLLVNAMFALGHAETKFKNAVSAFILGMLLSGTYIITESLWLAITIHILVDFYVMTIGLKYKRKLVQ